MATAMTTEPWTYPGYEKIADSPERWRLDERGWRSLRRATWVVTEKIHGANFCLATDGVTVRAANRRQWLADDDFFFGWQSVAAALMPAVRDLYARLGVPGLARVYVHGELFGGAYPHPDVAPVGGAQPVQTGVWYAPDVRFLAFDLRVETADGTSRYLDYADTVRLLEMAGVPCAQPLRVGSYSAVSEHSIRFDSTIPRWLGLPVLPAGQNLAEGVVIKPWCEVALRNADSDPVRPVLKRKIAEFAEDRRFHEAETWRETTRIGVDALDLLKWECYNRVTPSRRDAAISKVGGPGVGAPAGRIDLILTLVRDEVIEEAREAAPDAWTALASHERADLLAYVSDEVRALLPGADGGSDRETTS
jgi:Rnl2 family RNA ligase